MGPVDPLRASQYRRVIIRPVPGSRWASAMWIRRQSEREGQLRDGLGRVWKVRIK